MDELAVEYKDLHLTQIPIWSIMLRFNLSYTAAVTEAEYYNNELHRMQQQRRRKVRL